MQLVLCQECEPADTILLILSELGLDLDGNRVRFDLGAIEKLVEELTFTGSLGEHVFGETWGVRDAGLVDTE